MPSKGCQNTDLHDYISGGYYVARLREPGSGRPPSKLLPRRYVSASHCLCDFFPDSWVWNYAGPIDSEGNFVEGISRFEERLTSASRFGITKEQLPDVIRWGQLRCGRDFGIPRGFYRLVDARSALDWIDVPAEMLAIFGIGLHRSRRTTFLQETVNHPDMLVPECIRQQKELDGAGTALGHELLNTEQRAPGCSWICNGLECSFAERKGVTVNQYGYIDRFQTALECSGAINRGEIAGEPGPWFPWLIVEYT